MDATDIAKAAEQYVDEVDPSIRTGERIKDLGSADWYMRRLGELEREQRENRAMYEDALRRMKARFESMQAKAQRGVDFFRGELLRFMEVHRSELVTGQKRSRALLHGILGWRKTQGLLRVVDPKALEAWLMAQPLELGLARIKVEPNMKALQEHHKEHGVIPPGTELEVPRDAPYVRAVDPGTTLAKGEDDGND
jgi:phage host-nuclease inhibitor protein Gam